jgi:membrane protease YdiL (CAAX protease family)
LKRVDSRDSAYNSRTFGNTALRTPSKHQILLFLAIVFILTAGLQMYIIHEVKTVRSMAIVILMWIPGLVALACSNHFGNRLRDLALVKPGEQSVIFAYAIPCLCAMFMLFILVLIGIGNFKWPASSLLKVAVIQPTLGVVVALSLAFGAELGWRGFLHTHLLRARVPEPILVTGLIWSIWHWPLILLADYAKSPMPLLTVFLFTICMTSFSVILGWLREYSKSVLPCAIAHAVHNVWVQNIVQEFYKPGRLDPFFNGEGGFVLTIIYLVIAMYLYRRHVASSSNY